MKKYDVLKIIFESQRGLSAKDISGMLKTSQPNVYIYLKSLQGEGLIQKSGGRYMANKTSGKLHQVFDLQAMSPGKFHMLLSPAFGKIIEKFCVSPVVARGAFSASEIRKIEKIAVPSRIVLRLSLRPVTYCLKLNEALVQSILGYHGLKPAFSVNDFRAVVERADIRKPRETKGSTLSEPEVIKLCDEFYSHNGDIEIIRKADAFTPDERVADLLKSADLSNKEYFLFLNALDGRVREAILDQWKKRYVYNTNRIEGNTMSEKDVGDYLKSGRKPENISKREIHETSNTFHALNFLQLKKNEEISEELCAELHFMVQKDIDENPGEYKKFYNYVKPSSPTTPPQHVKERMRMLVEWYRKNRGRLHPFVLAAAFHMQYELIHPFADGNGRVGRLLMNHILQQNGYLPITILEKSKQNYYRALENRSLAQFLFYGLTTFIEEYRR